MREPAPLSVVVPTRDRPDHLRACLEALHAALRPGDEVVVADSASRDPSVAAVAIAFGSRLVRCDLPGASRARNAGAAAASFPLLAFVDDDVRVTAGWAHAMAAALERDGVSFVCGRVTAPPHQTGSPRPVALTLGCEARVLDTTCVSELGNSANLGIHQKAFDHVGGFDEALGAGTPWVVEDHDLFDRLLGAGHLGRLEPDALGWHEQWRSRRDLLGLDWRYGLGSGARLAKLLRTDPRRAARVFRAVTWRTDLCRLASVVRQRHEFAALTTSLRLLGTAVGLAVALTWRIERGHFRRRGQSVVSSTP